MSKVVDRNGREMRMAFKVYCFDNFVFVCCRRGKFNMGLGFGFTIDEALRNMCFMEV